MGELYLGKLLLKLVLLFFAVSSSLAASQVLAIVSAEKSDSRQVQLAPYLEVLEDPQGHLTLADVQQAAYALRFQTVPGAKEAINFSYTGSAYWFRLQLQPLRTATSCSLFIC